MVKKIYKYYLAGFSKWVAIPSMDECSILIKNVLLLANAAKITQSENPQVSTNYQVLLLFKEQEQPYANIFTIVDDKSKVYVA